MDHAKTTTPPTSVSRASTIVLDGMEREAEMTPPMSSSQSSDMERLLMQAEAQVHTHEQQNSAKDFKPHQMLMETTVSVEYGDNLTSKLTLHEEILRCHSKSFDQLCTKAKPLREQYVKSKRLMDQLASFVFPEVTAKQFEEAALEVKAIPLILQIVEKYPLLGYQNNNKKVVHTAVEEQIAQKNTKAPQTNGGTPKKRDNRDMNRDMSIRARLPLLKSQGMQAVAEQLYSRLHSIKKWEAEKAKDDPVRALAQQRILLPGFEDSTVQAFIHWIYRGILHYEGPEQLYALLNLATRLGADALAEMCLSKLWNAATDSIQSALANDVPLQALLGYGSDHTDSVLEVVFINVFKDKNPPKRLLKLVIDTLAENLDMDLWTQLRDLIGHGMALQLIEAMIVRQQATIVHSDQMSVKPESDDTAPEQSLFVTNNNH